MVNKRVRNAVLGCNLKKDRMTPVRFQGKPFKIMVIQAYAPTSNTEEAEVELFYEDIQDLLELTLQKYVLFIIEEWNTKLRLIKFFAAEDGKALYSQQKQDWELTVAQIMNSLLPNSDLN